MNEQKLRESLSEDIFTYVMGRGVSKSLAAEALTVDNNLRDRFTNYEELVDVHLLLDQAVTDFVGALPHRVRSIKTEQSSTRRSTRGEIRGRINWESTIKARYQENPHDRSRFIVEDRMTNYDIPENLVLKRVLNLLYSKYKDIQDSYDSMPQWLEGQWVTTEVSSTLERVVERAVHVTRIRDLKSYEPTDRMLNAAEKARDPIYRDAADILTRRERILQGDPHLWKSLLKNTAIVPDGRDRLFELWVIFQLIKAVERSLEGRIRLHPISPVTSRSEVAHFTGQRDLVLYHDHSGRDRGVSFRALPDSRPEDKLSRTEHIPVAAQRVANEYLLDRSEWADHTKRPDGLLMSVDEGSPIWLIVEVKHSSETETIRQGVKETLEYVAYLEDNGHHVFPDQGNLRHFGSGWNGLLVIDDLGGETVAPIDDQDEIKIVQADNDLLKNLERVIREVST